jgi:hypothetical protein
MGADEEGGREGAGEDRICMGADEEGGRAGAGEERPEERFGGRDERTPDRHVKVGTVILPKVQGSRPCEGTRDRAPNR